MSEAEPLGEISLPFPLCAISADDDVKHSEILQTTLTRLHENYQTLVPQNSDELFQFALAGNDGKPADIIFLDNDFSKNETQWQIKTPQLHALKGDISWDRLPHFNTIPDGSNFAIILRILGYTGPIVSFTGGPLQPRNLDVIRGVFELSLGISLGETPILQGYIAKNSMTYALGPKADNPGQWDTVLQENISLSTAFDHVLRTHIDKV